jgi:glycosyltransferase involved in cell wall biosynthesis
MAYQAPLVSVVIPCFNAENCVSDAIHSALQQTYPNVEVIVIDDGSTDSSLSRIESFGSRIRYQSGPNRGACEARNLGLAMAHGELIQFLDADDILYPEKITRQILTLPAGNEEVSYCDWREQWLNSDAGSRPRSTRCFEDSVVTVVLGTVQTPSVLHRRSILEKLGGFRPGVPANQDHELNLRLACNGIRFRRLPEELYLVRRRRGSISSDTVKVAEWGSKADLEWFNYLGEKDLLTDARRAAFARVLARNSRWLARAGKVQSARAWLATARDMHTKGWREAYGRREAWLLNVCGFVATEFIIRSALRARERVGNCFIHS